MTDITMCQNNLCPLRESCYRFTAIPNYYRQSYAVFEPTVVSEDEVNCDYYLEP